MRRRAPTPMLGLVLTTLRSRRCAFCGLRVRRDDPLGLLDRQLVHAECAIVHWLIGPGSNTRSSEGSALHTDALDPAGFADRVTDRADRSPPIA
jgi:hypothetical protein